MSDWWRLWGLSPEHSLMMKLLTVYFAASDPLRERGSFCDRGFAETAECKTGFANVVAVAPRATRLQFWGFNAGASQGVG